MTTRQNVTNKVVQMQPLHDDDDDAGSLVVEPRTHGVAKPVIGVGALTVRNGLVGLGGVVNNDEIRTATGKGAADRGRVAEPTGGGFEFLDRLPIGQANTRKQLAVELALHDLATVAGVLVGQVLAIAGAADLD